MVGYLVFAVRLAMIREVGLSPGVWYRVFVEAIGYTIGAFLAVQSVASQTASVD
jgi:hypothetical protein